MASSTESRTVREEIEEVDPRKLFSGYDESEGQPLGAYATLAGIFSTLFAVMLWVSKRTGRSVPSRMKLTDMALLGVATHKLSWIVANSSVTSFVRAPVTELREVKSPTSLDEEPRGQGLQKALGGLVTCHFCLGMWIAAFFSYGTVFFPRPTRFFGSILTILTLSDFLHQRYKKSVNRAE